MGLFAAIAPAYVFAKGFKIRACGRGVCRINRFAVDYGRTAGAKVFPAGIVQACRVYEFGAAIWASENRHTSIVALAGVETLCQ